MNKSAIVLDTSLPTGLLANAVACISSGIFSGESELVGPKIEGADAEFLPITKIPILILKPKEVSLESLCYKAQELGLKLIPFTKEAQCTTSYEEYAESVKGKKLKDLTVLGVGVMGETKTVNSLVGSLPMLR